MSEEIKGAPKTAPEGAPKEAPKDAPQVAPKATLQIANEDLLAAVNNPEKRLEILAKYKITKEQLTSEIEKLGKDISEIGDNMHIV